MQKPYRLKKRGKIWQYKLPNETSFHSTGKTVRADAEKYAIDVLNGAIDKGKKVTLQEFTENLFIPGKCIWLKAKESKGKGISKEMARMRRGHLDNHILPKFGNYLFDFITRDNVDQWLINLDNLSNATKNHIIDTLRIIWSEAEKKDLIKTNSMLQIEKFAKNNKNRDALEKEDLVKLFPTNEGRLIEIWGNLEWGCFFTLLATTGIRLSEARALTWSDIINHQDSGKHALQITKAVKNTDIIGKPKNGNTRIVFIVSSLNRIITKWRQESAFNHDNDLIFPNKEGNFLRRDTCSNKFKSALCNAEVDIRERNLVCHSLRHSFNTIYRPVIGDETLRQFTGHSSVSMTDHYDHRTMDTTISLLAKFEDMIEGEWNHLHKKAPAQFLQTG